MKDAPSRTISAQTPREIATGPRLIVDAEPRSGAMNMAVDEALLLGVVAGGPLTLRFYRWSEPTVSVGYFQRDTPELEPGGRFAGLAWVRRLSGGGAIIHHHELTYSVCVPSAHPLASQPGHLYMEMHLAIARALAEMGLQAEPRGAGDPANRTFLCFSRGDPRDLVIGGNKVVGSAQRRRQGAILQHGSILLGGSPFAPELPGILDLAPHPIPERALTERIIDCCRNALEPVAVPATLTAAEMTLARELALERYAVGS